MGLKICDGMILVKCYTKIMVAELPLVCTIEHEQDCCDCTNNYGVKIGQGTILTFIEP